MAITLILLENAVIGSVAVLNVGWQFYRHSYSLLFVLTYFYSKS